MIIAPAGTGDLAIVICRQSGFGLGTSTNEVAGTEAVLLRSKTKCWGGAILTLCSTMNAVALCDTAANVCLLCVNCRRRGTVTARIVDK